MNSKFCIFQACQAKNIKVPNRGDQTRTDLAEIWHATNLCE